MRDFNLDITIEEKTKKKKKEKFLRKETPNFVPKTDAQERFYRSLENNIISIAVGSAGTGKTLTSVAYAAKQLSQNHYDRLIICRSTIPSSKSLGFFPGTVEEKLFPWLAHVVSYCREYLGNGNVECLMRGEHPRIVMEPFETIRGRSWSDAIILIEEAQQLTFEEMKMCTTRIGDNSKMIVTADPCQRDIQNFGLEKFIDIVNKHKISDIGITKFTPDDIVRSSVVKDLIIAFEKEGV